MPGRLYFALGLVVAALGHAQPASADPAAAEALFREGHRLLLDGNYEAAAAKLAASQALDPASGTLINLALAYERQGRLATAWATYREAAISARHDGRAARTASAERKQAELEPRVPKFWFHIERAPADLSIGWATVRVGAGVLDSAIPVDPGTYRVVVEAPGYAPWATDVSVAEGDQQRITIPDLQPLPPVSLATPLTTAVPGPSPLPTAKPKTLAPTPAPAPARSGDTLAWALGISGIASMGLGAAFGVRALGRYSDAEEACPTHTGCSPRTMTDWRSAKSSAWVSNIAVGAGAVACAASAWLFFSNRPARTSLGLSVAPVAAGAALVVHSHL